MEIRKVRRDDLNSLVELYEIVWPEVDYDKKAKAKFILEESEGVNFCAEDDGIIVGSRMSYFQNMHYGGKKMCCVEMCDSCVHPSYRGHGLFLKMNKMFLEEFFSSKIGGELIFNISAYASSKAHKKLGWQYISSLMALRKIQRPWHLFSRIILCRDKLFRPLVLDKGHEDVTIDNELLKIREEWMLHQRPLLHIRYDDDTYKWRMKSNSGIKVLKNNLLGSLLYKLGHRGVFVEVEIGEVFLYVYTKKNFRLLLKQLIKEVRPDLLTVLISEGHPLLKWYKDSFFIFNPKKKYLRHGVRVKSEEMKSICYNPKNWALSSLDIDTF